MIAYRDLAGRNFATQATYRQAGANGRDGMYYDPKIESLAGNDDPGESMLATQRRIDEDLQTGRYKYDPPPEHKRI
jgi:hypothetical protein